MKLNEVHSQRTAFFIFQAAVNAGDETAVRWAQLAAAANGCNPGIDGVIGQRTIYAINSMDAMPYLRDMAVFQRYFYLMRIIEDPIQGINKKGWEKRVRESLAA